MVDQHSLSQSPDNSLSRTPACSTTEQAGFSSSITSEFNSDNRLCRHLPTVSCVRHFRCRIIAFFAQFCEKGRYFGGFMFAYIKYFLYLCTRFQKCSFSRSEQPLVAVHSNVLQHPASPHNRFAP